MHALRRKGHAGVIGTAFHIRNHNPFNPHAKMIRKAPNEVVAHRAGSHHPLHGETNCVTFRRSNPDRQRDRRVIIFQHDDAGIGVAVVQHLLDGQSDELRGLMLLIRRVHG